MRDGLGHPIVTAITEDRRGRLWVSTLGGGVARLIEDPQEGLGPGGPRPATRKKLVSYSLGHGLFSDNVTALLFDDDNALWCVTIAGLYRAAASPSDSLKFEVVPGMPAPEKHYAYRAAFADRQGRLWFVVSGELVEFAQGRITKYALPGEIGHSDSVKITEDRQHNLLISGARVVFEFLAPNDAQSRERWKKLPLSVEPYREISLMVAGSTGALWIGTLKGLIKYEEDRQTAYTTAKGLREDPISAFCEDREGNLWVGFYSGGVGKLFSETFVSFPKVDGLSHPNVLKVIEDSEGRIYASTSGEGVFEIVDGKAVPVPGSQASPFDGFLNRIVQDRRGDWWVGADQSLFKFPGPKLQFRHGEKFTAVGGIEAGPWGPAIYEDPAGRLWVSPVNDNKGGLCWMDPGRNGRPVVECMPLNNLVIWMTRDSYGALWVGAHTWLGRLVGDKLVSLQPSEGLPATEPRAFFQDSRGWLWIGLRYHGVSVTKDPAAEHPTFVNYSAQKGLASDTVWSITEDDLGRIYLGTGRGLDQLDLSTGRIRHFNTRDGLAGDLVQYCLKDRRGHIWVGTSTGLSRYDPRAERAPGPPPIYLSRIQVAGEELPLPERGARQMPAFRLPAARNNLLVEYVGLSFQGEHALRYQYKLEGVDADWTPPSEQRSVTYARLAPGSYQFLVRAIN